MYVIEHECDISEVNHHQTYTELKTIRLIHARTLTQADTLTRVNA